MSKRAKVSSGTVQARIRHNIPLYLMFLPGAIYLLINNYIPMAGLVIAFKQVNWNKGILKSPWVGFSNFEYLFKTKEAWNITRNTLGYNIVFIILGTVIAIAVALRQPLGLTSLEMPTLVAISSTPVAVSSAVMAQEMGCDDQLANQLVVWTSVLSMVSLFCIIYVMRTLALL